MDTKLKNIKFSPWFTLLAVTLGIIGVLLSFYGILNYQDFSYGVQQDYKKSTILADEMSEISTNLARVTQLKNKEYILSGAGISDNELKRKIGDIKEEKNQALRSMMEKYDFSIIENKEHNPQEAQLLQEELDGEIAQLKQHYDKEIMGAREKLIAEELVQYNKALGFLENYEGLYYTVVSHVGVTGQNTDFYKTLPYYQESKDFDDGTFYIGFSAEGFRQQVQAYEARHSKGLNGIYMLLSGLGFLLLSIGWLVFSAGRTPHHSELKFNYFDKIYLDFGLLVTGTIVMSCSIMAGIIITKTQNSPLYDQLAIILLITAYLTLAAYAVMFAKRVKSCEVVTHTFLYRCYKAFLIPIATLAEGSSFTKKIIGLLLLYLVALGMIGLLFIFVATFTNVVIGMLCATGVLILLLSKIIHFALQRITAFIKLAEGIKKIKNGDLAHEISACGFGVIDAMADDVNHIADGVKTAVDREIKAEHMKVELITNVSHDLKTPLTSIITYSDLLLQEQITGEQVTEYAEILKRKSERLKQMVDDLFEISKAQSGSISVTLETLCLNDLIIQSFAEYEEDFKKSGLDIMLNIPQEKMMIVADGAKMWRVLSNIYNNALKYSMSGTRVYIDMEVMEDAVNIIVKNIASDIMNFTGDEICERFKRGDESRSEEGSGLGLAIVKSFMTLQKGSCQILVDGDLFKVTLTLVR